ncbi:MAG: hypothetical protein RR466_05815, partial [Hungatella sp.]
MEVKRFQDNYETQLVREGKILLLNEKNNVLLSPESNGNSFIDTKTLEGILRQTDFAADSSTQKIKM